MRVTIFGGHGKIALLLAPMLVEAGHEVTSVVRNPDHVADVEATGATARVSSVEDADTAALADLLSGQDAVVWSAGAGGGDPDRTYAVDRDAAIRSMDAAQAADVRRYVMVSFMGASLDHSVPEDDPFHAYAQSKAEADEHLRTSELEWTILGPSTLSMTVGTERVDVEPLDEGESAADVASTSRANVAHMIVAALGSDAAIGRQVEFTDGGTPISEVFTA